MRNENARVGLGFIDRSGETTATAPRVSPDDSNQHKTNPAILVSHFSL
jgi:hypothetical protein